MYFSNNICFVCLTESDKKNLRTVFHKDPEEEIFAHVKYVLPELIVWNYENPVCICSTCCTTFRTFYIFKKKCLENYSRWKQYTQKLQETSNTEHLKNSELQIKIDDKQLIKQNQDVDIVLSITVESEDTRLSSKEQDECETVGEDNIVVKKELLTSEESEMEIDDNEALINQESQLCTVSNIKDMNETVIKDNIGVKGESLASEDSADEELNQQPEFVNVKCESVSDDEQDGVSNVISVDNNALDKDETSSNTDIKRQEIQCLICNEAFTNRLKFNTHWGNHIKNIEGLECVICDKKFSKKKYLNVHMKTHLGIKGYECSTCKKKFSQHAHLKRHIKSHLGIRDIECSICKKKFAQCSHLKYHMKIHEGIKEHECSICKRKFSQSSNLTKHMNIHKGIKAYECTICKKKFSENYSMKVHMKIHEGIKDFKCTICNKKFSRNYYLHKHMKNHQKV